MTIYSIALFLSTVSLAATTAGTPAIDHKAMFKLWNQIQHPTSASSESIGSYSAGCLAGAEKLDIDGQGYSVMRPSRLRYFGHPNLLRFLHELSAAIQEAGLPRILIGDMGRPRGGPMISGHASHQIGLDVDIWYDFSKNPPSMQDREKQSATSFVNGKDGSIRKGWSDSQRKLLELAAENKGVDRIFVHAGIKRDMCAKFPDAPWLYKLRPWWGHDDHLHVRLSCPEGSPLCEKQDPIKDHSPECGKELAWWFSQAAKDEWKIKSASIGRIFPKLPAACEPVRSTEKEKL